MSLFCVYTPSSVRQKLLETVAAKNTGIPLLHFPARLLASLEEQDLSVSHTASLPVVDAKSQAGEIDRRGTPEVVETKPL